MTQPVVVVTDSGEPDPVIESATDVGEIASAAAEAVAEVVVAVVENQETDSVSRAEFNALRSDVQSLTSAVESFGTIAMVAAETAADAAEEVAESVPDAAEPSDEIPAPQPRVNTASEETPPKAEPKKQSRSYGSQSWFSRD